MWCSAWFIARKDVHYILVERQTLVWLFIMPIVFFYFVGTITGGFTGDGSTKDRLAVKVPDQAGFLADEVIRQLETVGYEIVRPATDEEFAASSRQLTIPADFTASILAGKQVILSLHEKDAGPNQQYDQVRVARAGYTVLANLVACAAQGKEPTQPEFARLNAMPRTMQVEVQAGGKRLEIPTGFEQAIPGTMVMFTMTVLLTSGAGTLVAERRLGILRRLASTPISRNAVVLGKWGGRIILGFIQIAFAMLAGTLIFGMRWGPDLPMVVLVLLGWGSLCAALALLLGNLMNSEGGAIALGVLASNGLAALGGCWWPIEITPQWMQSLSHFLPTGWAMDAMHKLVSFRSGPASALPHLAALSAAALVVGWIAARRFRFQ